MEHCSHILPIYILPYMLTSDTLPSPHPSHTGVACVNYILHRASYIQHIQDHDHDGGVGGVAGLDHICIYN